jgi:hypothetical protein
MTTALEDGDVTDVLIVTAWLRQSGLELLVPGLEAVRKRRGKTRLLFGIDLMGTSRQGVVLAQRHVTHLHVVCDPSGRTFHPKMYLAVGDRIGYALIGSNNMTAGGLWHNYEGAVLAIFDPRREPEIAEGVQTYARRLLGDTAICKRVTPRVFDQLLAEGRLADEAHDRRRHNEDRPKEESSRRSGPVTNEPLFTTSEVEKRTRPAPTRKHTPRPVPRKTRRRIATAPDSWWKQLGAGDAQRPQTGHPTGNITLTQVPRGQDREKFFRTVFFGGERWRRSGVGRMRTESIMIDTHILIGRRDLGQQLLTVIYRPYRGEHGRATTVLRWGESLLKELHEHDVAGWYLLIERADMRTYRLSITPNQPA